MEIERAHHWSLRSIYSNEVATAIFNDLVAVGVDTEVPLSKDDQPVPRYGNRYYPTFVKMELHGADVTLFPEEALALAKSLAEAAHMAETADAPDMDRCGHWGPCDCGGKNKGQ